MSRTPSPGLHSDPAQSYGHPGTKVMRAPRHQTLVPGCPRDFRRTFGTGRGRNADPTRVAACGTPRNPRIVSLQAGGVAPRASLVLRSAVRTPLLSTLLRVSVI